MLRSLETSISLIPFVFLEPEGIFTQRNSDLCMVIIREVIQGHLGRFFVAYKSENKRIETQGMILSPIAGIYICLYNSSQGQKLSTIEDCIVKADGFESKLMKSFIDILKQEKSKDVSKGIVILTKIINSLEGFIEKHYSPVYLGLII